MSTGPRGQGPGGSRFGRAVVAAILEEIAARLRAIGVIGGTKIDASHLIGAAPAGVSRVAVQHDGATVATTGTLNFVGGFALFHDAARDRVDVGLDDGGVAPGLVYVRATGEVVYARTGGEDVLTRSV